MEEIAVAMQTKVRAEENPRSRPTSTMKNLIPLVCVIVALVNSEVVVPTRIIRPFMEKVLWIAGEMGRSGYPHTSAQCVSIFSYQCYYAFCRNSTTCNENVTECLGDRCMTASQYDYIDGTLYRSSMKGCANETVCGADGLAAAAGKFHLIFHVKCCSGNLCNTDGYYLPKEDPTLNGVKCPSAYCTGTLEECESDEEMDCTGSMDHCFEYRQRIINEGKQIIYRWYLLLNHAEFFVRLVALLFVLNFSALGGEDQKYSIKGCANSDACNYNYDNNIAVVVEEKKYGKCYVPSNSNHL
ncbi:uncharacterized protein LOC142256731 [Anomaloglossus baeobatrachus]|uniref:uncharacterized protein LOC142256731 n=1 Tax=Anomaloglossus baeobatrachus TaxID=238106 RepID=UPI003F5010D5